MTRKEKLLAFLEEAAQAPLLSEELAVLLGVAPSDRPEMERLLDELVAEGLVIRTRRKRYGAAVNMGCVKGRFIGNERGFGFVETEGEERDVFIPAGSAGGAVHNDTVLAKIVVKETEDRRCEGEVVRVLKRGAEAIAGVFEKNGSFGFVVPDEKKIPVDIFIPADQINGAQNDDRVVVKITRWESNKRNPEGMVAEVLGSKHDVGTDILSIIRGHGLREVFPKKVEDAARSVPPEVEERELNARLDLRRWNTITIDGDDAKDLDDAVSVTKLKNGNYKLGVHIADVGHYVRRGSALDKEAFARGTSVYLVDRVIPMLPKELSNGICSLNPQVDRLALSVVMEIDHSGVVVKHKIAESVIRSKARMTYHDVTAILEGDSGLARKYAKLVRPLRLMNELKDILHKKRAGRGSIDFDFPETKILLNDKGKPVEVKKYETGVSNQIIEEFMLVCNETVAEHMFRKNMPFVYRVHEVPSEDKIREFVAFINPFGYSIKHTQNKVHPKEFQKLLGQIRGKKEERIISTVMLRSLMKARYSEENLGHFGLAAKYYCHFTSPIRRYPDLTIHRIIKDSLNGRKIDYDELKHFVHRAAEQSSDREIAAMEAERDTDDLKMAEYMAERIGERYEGIISSVTSFGMFVELENTIEGLVRMADLDDDYYIFDEKNHCLIGEHKKHVYHIGDTVMVQVARADTASRQIDFVLCTEGEEKKSLSHVSVKKRSSKSRREAEQRLLKKNPKKTPSYQKRKRKKRTK